MQPPPVALLDRAAHASEHELPQGYEEHKPDDRAEDRRDDGKRRRDVAGQCRCKSVQNFHLLQFSSRQPRAHKERNDVSDY